MEDLNILVLLILFSSIWGAWLIYKGMRHSWRERGKAQKLKVRCKFIENLRKRPPMARRYTD